jgi:hypothetical protein
VVHPEHLAAKRTSACRRVAESCCKSWRTPKQIRDLRGTSVLFKTDGDKVKKFFLPNG